ncbi:MAG: hypothetical protein KGY66_00790 [Candidatus Thermoplasmatota archaeon]|nr:hypothetical protein [Candidatus Thermoplasmatota archaeon]MBS3789439.1 hypothetical protein [Candidatus Thermoplasmatota archaeon]
MEEKSPEYPESEEKFVSDTAEDILDSLLYKSNLYVVGIGGCGCNTVEYIAEKELDSVKTVAINTDERVLGEIDVDRQMLIGKELTDGNGADGDPSIGRRAAEQSEGQILKTIDQADMVVIVAGMGGGTGSGASEVIADLAKRNGKMVVTYAVMPFSAEKERYEKAESALENISELSNATTIFENDETLIHSDESPKEAFEMADRMLYRLVEKLKMNYIQEFFEEIGLDAMGLSESVSEAEKEEEREVEQPPVLEAIKYVDEKEEKSLDGNLENYTP